MIDFDNTDSAWRKYDPSKLISTSSYFCVDSGDLFKFLKIFSHCKGDFEAIRMLGETISRCF